MNKNQNLNDTYLPYSHRKQDKKILNIVIITFLVFVFITVAYSLYSTYKNKEDCSHLFVIVNDETENLNDDVTAYGCVYCGEVYYEYNNTEAANEEDADDEETTNEVDDETEVTDESEVESETTNSTDTVIKYGVMYEATFISVTSSTTLKVEFNGETQEIIMLLVEYDEDELTTTEDDAIEYLNSILSSGQTIYLSFPRSEENQQSDDGQYRCYVWLSENIDNFYQPSQDFFLSYSPAAMLVAKGLMIPSKENSDYNKYYIMLGVFQEYKEYFSELIPE